MNCREINHLLDALGPESLTQTQADAIDRHLSSCAACRDEWASWRDIAALVIPPLPAALRGRIAAALPAQMEPSARKPLRPFIIGGVLVATAAAAAAVLLQLGRNDSSPATPPVVAAQAGRGDGIAQAPPTRPATAPDAAGSPPGEIATSNINAEPQPAADPRRIVVVQRPEEAADAADLALASLCYEAVVRELRTFDGLGVVTEASLLTIATPVDPIRLPESDRQIARAHGAGKMLVISTSMGCNATLFDSITAERVPGAGLGGVDAAGTRAESYGRSVAQLVRDKTMLDAKTELGEARASVLNPALNDQERIGALWKLRASTLGQGRNAAINVFDEEVVAAAARIAINSESADLRGSIWAGLRSAYDTSLVAPLLQALAGDPVAEVRMQAAVSLRSYLDQPGVLAALQKAANEDANSEPGEHLMRWTVRDAALRAAVPDKDFRTWVRTRLGDESLSARERLMPFANMTMDQRMPMLSSFDEEANAVVFEVGRRQQNPQLRQMAWDALSRGKPRESFVPVLLGDLNNHADESVRAAAASALARLAARPEVREALDRAMSDPSVEVRRAASWRDRWGN